MLTYLDSNILILAYDGPPGLIGPARQIVTDPRRQFASSAMVQLEVLPKPAFDGRTGEVLFLEYFFLHRVHRWAQLDPATCALALTIARQEGLTGPDAPT